MNQYRSGFSLIEVMVAMSICLLGLTVLLQMTSMAQRYSQRSNELAGQQIICQNILNEISSGLRGWNDTTNKVYDSDPRFEFSVTSTEFRHAGLRLVEVVVRRADIWDKTGTGPSKSDVRVRNPRRTAREFRLARLVTVESAGMNTPEGGPSFEERSQVLDK
jgi:prepilin-type N-terminal cleavage/methylation domain-containing protein